MPFVVTLGEISSSVKPEQPQKAELPFVVKLDGI
jgi:hypothetical protein